MNIYVQVFDPFEFVSRNGIAGHMMSLYLAYCGPAKLFSTAAAPFYIPTGNVQGSHSFHILLTLVIFQFSFSYNSHANECEVASHTFGFHFPND